jgi:drug/metabolite transporter (DMT)-like permease
MDASRVSTQPILAEDKPIGLFAGKRFWIAASLLTVYIIWGTTYLGIRYALESFPPHLLMGIRFALAGSILFGFLRARGAAMPTLKQWRSATIVGVLLLVFAMGSVAIAEQSVSSGLAATLAATAPLWAMLFSMIWRSFPTRSEWIGVGLGLVGVVLLSFEGNLQANPAGVLLVLFAAVSWALGSVWMRHLDMPKGSMGNAAEMLAGGAILIVLGLARGEHIVGTPTVPALLALAYLITFGSLATLTAYVYLLKNVSPALALSYSFVNPAIALLLGVLIGGEHLTGSALIALPVILVGVFFVLRPKAKVADGGH